MMTMMMMMDEFEMIKLNLLLYVCRGYGYEQRTYTT